jgi:hypothetical protein
LIDVRAAMVVIFVEYAISGVAVEQAGEER